MDHCDDMDANTGENRTAPEDLEALQQQRLLAYRATASIAPLHHGLSLYGLPTLPALSSDMLDPLAARINAQQILRGSRAASLSDFYRFGGMLGGGIGVQPSLSSSSDPNIGLTPLHHVLPAAAYRQRLLLERSQQHLPTQPHGAVEAALAVLEASASRASLGMANAQGIGMSQLPHLQNESGSSSELPSASSTSLAIADAQREDATREDQDRLPRVVFAECDEKHLSEYQCLLRQQIEFYASDRQDMKWNIQGRNRAVVKGQVGLRCRWCAHIPVHRRAPGAVYYSSSLDGLYQAGQNMAKNHFCKGCNHIPMPIKKKLTQLRDTRRRAPGGKRYWAEGARAIGIYEGEGGLQFKNKASSSNSSGVEVVSGAL